MKLEHEKSIVAVIPLATNLPLATNKGQLGILIVAELQLSDQALPVVLLQYMGLSISRRGELSRSLTDSDTLL